MAVVSGEQPRDSVKCKRASIHPAALPSWLRFWVMEKAMSKASPGGRRSQTSGVQLLSRTRIVWACYAKDIFLATPGSRGGSFWVWYIVNTRWEESKDLLHYYFFKKVLLCNPYLTICQDQELLLPALLSLYFKFCEVGIFSHSKYFGK